MKVKIIHGNIGDNIPFMRVFTAKTSKPKIIAAVVESVPFIGELTKKTPKSLMTLNDFLEGELVIETVEVEDI